VCSSDLPEKGKVAITNIFIGDKVCRTCHLTEYKLWKETKHARAYQSLINKNQQFDLECIGCHTTGYGREGGFPSLGSLGKFKGVQCEECHGPGDKHQRGGNIVKSVSEDVCLRCHTRERSPGFNYTKYLEAVQKNLLRK
jgi:predicted CXXCH cytochrome family protein